MKGLKLKYTLEEANKKIVSYADLFPQSARNAYTAFSGVSYPTLRRYMMGKVSSPVAANHLVEYIELYMKKNNVEAA